ncbi:MAG: Gfo/Idh/MocA family oxidoreductase [Acidimicrobiales bacterium]
MSNSVRVLLVGAGHMGIAHGRAFHTIPDFELCGIVTRGESGAVLAAELGDPPHFRDFSQALADTRPDAVAIASFTETHVPYTTAALEAGCHVFVEKPLAASVAEAQGLVDLAADRSLVLVVGYILRHHPSWQAFIELAKDLGKPLVMRMNLNQQSDGDNWLTHKALMATTSPLVDCGVHYVDVMSQMTGATAVRVSAIGARLSDELVPGMYNYGQLQVTFDDGSVGWYESGWGPMMSETAYFVKDVIGPNGSASIEAVAQSAGSADPSDGAGSADVDSHTATNRIRHHRGALDRLGRLAAADELLDTADEPSHDELCRREQEWFLAAIGGEVEIGSHLVDAVESLRIVLAADESIKTGRAIEL